MFVLLVESSCTGTAAYKSSTHLRLDIKGMGKRFMLEFIVGKEAAETSRQRYRKVSALCHWSNRDEQMKLGKGWF